VAAGFFPNLRETNGPKLTEFAESSYGPQEGVEVKRTDGSALIDGFSDDVHDASQSSTADGNLLLLGFFR